MLLLLAHHFYFHFFLQQVEDYIMSSLMQVPVSCSYYKMVQLELHIQYKVFSEYEYKQKSKLCFT